MLSGFINRRAKTEEESRRMVEVSVAFVVRN